jgi:hypothetical protein
MESKLEANKHYIEVKDDYSDLDEKIEYYIRHPEESEAILHNAHEFLQPFRDSQLEDVICIRVLDKYFKLSGQS